MKSFFKVENLCYGYIRQPLCLKDVNFSVEKKDNILVLGLDDKGKSTLIKTISGFDRRYLGRVYLDGVDVKSISDKDKNFSLILKDPILIDGSIDRNLNYLYDVIGKTLPSNDEKKELLKQFNLSCDLQTNVKKLSLFEKFKFVFLRVFIKKPRIVFIDNIFENSFNDDEVKELVEIIENVTKDCLMFLCLNEKTFKKQYSFLHGFKLANVLYLNMAMVHQVKSVNEFLQTPIDLDALAFCEDYQTLECSCMFKDGMYFLVVNDLLLKIDKDLYSNFESLKIDDMDTEDIVLAFKKGKEIDFSKNNDVNEMISKGDVLLFSKLDRSRIN